MFKKQFFPESVVRSIANNQDIYQQGIQLSEDDASFEEIEIDANERKISLHIKAHNQCHKVEMSFLKNGIASTYSCTCEAFEKYAGACEHVVASMAYLNRYSIEELAQSQSEAALVGDIKNRVQKNKMLLENLLENPYLNEIYDYQEILQFEYILNMHQLPNQPIDAGLYMRVGLDYLYVVHDFSTVLRFLINQREYSFGKQFSYHPQHHKIASSDMKLLVALNEIDQLSQRYTNEGTNSNYGQSPLVIPPAFVDKILTLMNETNRGKIRWGYPPNSPTAIRAEELYAIDIIKDEKIPVQLTIIKDNEDYKIHLHPIGDDVPFIEFLEQTPYLRVNHSLFKIKSKDIYPLKKLLTTFDILKEEALYLNAHQLSEFLSLYWTTVKKYFHIQINDDIFQDMIESQFKTKIKIDYRNQKLTIEPTFSYGAVDVSPFQSASNEAQSVLVVRDFQKEAEILNHILHLIGQVSQDSKGWYFADLADLSHFLYEDMIRLDTYYPVYLSDEVKKMIYRPKESPKIFIERQAGSNLLNIQFQMEDIPPHEMTKLLQMIKEKQRFYRLKTGQIIDLEQKDLKELSQAMQALGLEAKDLNDTSLSIPLIQGINNFSSPLVKRGAQFQQLLEQLKSPQQLSFKLPRQLRATLRNYQKIGFQWLKTMDYYGFGAVLADDMGLGKTLQAIAFILSKWEESGGKYLVICPSSVMYNWKAEIEKFAPALKSQIISGSAIERKKILAHAMADPNNSLIITSYPLIHRDIDAFKDYFFNTIVLDESQNIKNVNTKTSRAIKQLQCENMIALSGTPIENNLNELWSLFSTVQPGLFKSQKDFQKLSKEEISNKISFFILRRLKEEVLQDLPPKTETEQFIELSDEQKRIYQVQLAVIRHDLEEYMTHHSFDQHRIQILAGMTRLRQICNDPRLIDSGYKGPSAKLERLFEFLEEAQKNKKRVVLFSQFTSMLAIIRDVLDRLGRDYHYLDGQTDKKERLILTERFNSGEKDLFLISLKAGGVGLNLTGGDTVILYDSWWNPAIEDQATDRVHRFGQKKPVQVLRLITKGTIEEGIYKLQEQKRELVDSVMQSEQLASIKKLSKEDIIKLLN
ncbi:DEAD/DEAH box helicase [Allofustis seminis]|uniref:DEAD/DEAH box helicase n=1 Tax=Allofustis seminis TaxID=166939 RepID=UPI0003636588|nr:DEAD/DEAH box helicase [Allofustis seminis]